MTTKQQSNKPEYILYLTERIKQGWARGKDWVITIISLVILIIIAESYGNISFLWLVTLLCLYIVLMLARRIPLIMAAMRNIETAIWKKPLDKEYWCKGEIKNRKVKFVWKKS